MANLKLAIGHFTLKVVVPMHPDTSGLDTGTLSAILDTADISAEKFLRLL